jgi:hypothetical protein
MRAGAAVARASARSVVRPAWKNHSWSRSSGPPIVYSWIGTTFETVASPVNGVNARHESFSNASR